MLSAISGQFFAGHWNRGLPPNRPPLVTNSFLNYDMNYGSYTPTSSVVVPVSSLASYNAQIVTPNLVQFVLGTPSYIDLSTSVFNDNYMYATMGSEASALAGRNFTISAWVKPDSTGQSQFIKYDSGPNPGYVFLTSLSTELRYQIGFTDSSAALGQIVDVFVVGAWNLITIYMKPTATNVTMITYSNGVLRDTVTVNSINGPIGWGTNPSSMTFYSIMSGSAADQLYSNIQLYLNDTTFTPTDHINKWNSEKAYYGR